MTFSPKNKQSGFLLAGIAFALLTGALGWHVAGPGKSEALVVDDDRGFSAGARTAVGSAPKMPAEAKAFLAEQAPPVSAPSMPDASPAPKMQPPSAQVARAAVERVTEIDPALPGNFLVTNGQQVSIQQTFTDGAGRGTALNVAITPVANAAKASTTAQSESDAVQNQTSPARAGFTYEQDLFRSKWGWAAYDAANRAATWEVQRTTPATR